MIICKTPHRVSLFGGGTDYPSYIKKYGSLIIGSAIKQYSYVVLKTLPSFFDYKTKCVYSNMELVSKNENIQHRVIRSVFEYCNLLDRGIETQYISDVPSKCGLGSSSSFLVGMTNACHSLLNRPLGPDKLASITLNFEQSILKENVGYQDTLFAAHGGFNLITITPDFNLEICPLVEYQNIYEKSLMLFYSGVSRNSSDIISNYIKNIDNNPYQQLIHSIADSIGEEIRTYQLKYLGEAMTETHHCKMKLSPSNYCEEIEQMGKTAISNGAYGYKMTGGGGGGCILLLVPPDEFVKQKIRESLCGKIEIPIEFESLGSQIIYV